MSKIGLTVIVPVYNEERYVAKSLERLFVLEASLCLSNIQVIIIDDCSQDHSPQILKEFVHMASQRKTRIPFEWEYLRQEKNRGKGNAIKTGLLKATGDITIFHDADLEYYPSDILKMIPLFIEEGADAVYGSRYIMGDFRYVHGFYHSIGNKLLTFWGNLFANLHFTDMHTCYKSIRTSLLRDLCLVSDDFRLDTEITMKLAKRDVTFLEVPIKYSGRTYREGKKIRWIDGIKSILAVVFFAFSKNKPGNKC